MILLRVNCALLLFASCTFVGSVAEDDDPYYTSDHYDDPLRRTLGLLGRVLNRMSQPTPPTDEQLHFRTEEAPDIQALSKLIRQQQKVKSKTDRIINEELLQRLIPRVKGQTLPPRTPATTPPRPTTTISTTTPVTTTSTTTTTTTTTTAPVTTTTQEQLVKKSISDKSLTVRVKSVEETLGAVEDAPTSAELNEQEVRDAHVIAEALKILLREEGSLNSSSASSVLRSILKGPVEKNSVKSEEQVDSTHTATSTTSTTVEPTTMEEVTSETTTEETEATTEEVSTTAIFRSAGKLGGIPEAEEEEANKSSESVDFSFQDTASSTSTTAAPLSGQTVYNLNANANSNSDPQVASVFTPVNAIVDGFGPLILPLIGYSRQALASYSNRAAGVNSYQPANADGRPVQLRALPNSASSWTEELMRARNQPVPVQRIQQNGVRQQSDLTYIKSASDYELIQAFQKAAQANPKLISAIAGGLPSSTTAATKAPVSLRPRARFLPDPPVTPPAESFQQKWQQELQGRELLAQRQQQQIHAHPMPFQQEVVGSTRPNELPYYGPELDRYRGQENYLSAATERRRPEAPPTQPLPSDPHPDPGYADGLRNVQTHFLGDSGVMVDENAFRGNTQAFRSEPEASFASPALSGGSGDDSSGGGGFGGGRKPSVSFEDAEKNTDESLSNFFG